MDNWCLLKISNYKLFWINVQLSDSTGKLQIKRVAFLKSSWACSVRPQVWPLLFGEQQLDQAIHHGVLPVRPGALLQLSVTLVDGTCLEAIMSISMWLLRLKQKDDFDKSGKVSRRYWRTLVYTCFSFSFSRYGCNLFFSPSFSFSRWCDVPWWMLLHRHISPQSWSSRINRLPSECFP